MNIDNREFYSTPHSVVWIFTTVQTRCVVSIIMGFYGLLPQPALCVTRAERKWNGDLQCVITLIGITFILHPGSPSVRLFLLSLLSPTWGSQQLFFFPISPCWVNQQCVIMIIFWYFSERFYPDSFGASPGKIMHEYCTPCLSRSTFNMYIQTLNQVSIQSPGCVWEVWGNWRTCEKPELRTNWRPWRCGMAKLPALPLLGLLIIL